MQDIIKKHIEDILETNIVLEKPKDRVNGHYATPIAFLLAKTLKKSPIIIAQDLVKKFDNSHIFQSVEAIKGFLNFRLSLDFINNIISSKDNFCKKDKNNHKILLEYVSANPTGPLHIGHARGAILGDTLFKIGQYLGYDITREYYVNDAGSQMDLLALSICLSAREFIYNEKVTYPEVYYRGDYLIDIAKSVIEKFGKDIIYDKSSYSKIAFFAKDLVLELIKKDLLDIGIEFDSFISEKELYSNWDEIHTRLEQNSALYKEDDKLFLKSTKFGDDSNRVVVRENNIPTYLAGDIIYHSNKFDRSYDKYINIWGADHHGYIKRVKASIEFLDNDSNKLEIILSQMVSLLKGGKPYKMSKRAGNVILLSDIFNKIGSDALRFIFLSKKSDTHLEFDLDIFNKKDSSNPIFYIQYAHARIHQIFKKSTININNIKDFKLDGLNDDGLNLLCEALMLENILKEAFIKRDIQKITNYLYNLSSLFHRFYSENKIVGSINEKAILKTVFIVALCIKTALKLLGIDAKNSM